jgi:hypothetical protein
MYSIDNKTVPGGISGEREALVCRIDLDEFGGHELNMAADVLRAFVNHMIPNDFCMDDVALIIDKFDRSAFLTNSDAQTLKLHDGALELWYNTPHDYHVGYASDLKSEYESNPETWYIDDVQYLIDCGIIDDPAHVK